MQERYRDPAAPVAERVADLLGRMTLREKVGQLNQRLLGWNAWRRDGAGVAATEELEREAAHWGGIGAVYGTLRADAWSGRDWANGADPALSVAATALVRERVVAASRFGIPPLLVEEAPHGHQALGSTLLPVPFALGATWRPDLIEEAARRVARELQARGAHLALVSGLDLLRDPRWGRAEECLAEDPVLAAEHVAAFVRGFAAEPGIGVVLKHFAGQGAGIGGRNSSGAPIGPRELAEIHLPAARAGVAAGAVGVMAAYNDIDGVPCCANEALLTGLLRDDWGFDGVVMADMFAIDRLTRSTGSPVASGALALRAGVDLSMCDVAYGELEDAVASGLVAEEVVDRACARVLRLKIELGLLDPPAELPPFPPPVADVALAASGAVLLTDSGLLPLAAGGEIAVLGPLAADAAALLGDYVPPLAAEPATVADALGEAGFAVTAEAGCGITDTLAGGIDRAVAVARAAGRAVLVLGTTAERGYDDDFEANGAASLGGGRPRATTGEGFDAAEVRLPESQLALARAVAATGVPTVAVVITGRPLGLEELADAVDALLVSGYPGPHGGVALAELLLGRIEPRGRLAASLPAASGRLPVAYDDRLETTVRYIDGEAVPRFPFGTGRGYTSWSLGDPRPTGSRLDDLRVAVPLRNTGSRAGEQVVQLYARALVPGLVPRRAVLVGFADVALSPGEAASVELRPRAAAAAALGLEGPHASTAVELWTSIDGPARPDSPVTVTLTS